MPLSVMTMPLSDSAQASAGSGGGVSGPERVCNATEFDNPTPPTEAGVSRGAAAGAGRSPFCQERSRAKSFSNMSGGLLVSG